MKRNIYETAKSKNIINLYFQINKDLTIAIIFKKIMFE